MLKAEKNRKQKEMIVVPDMYTIAYNWKGEKKLREHVYDQILTSDVTQETV